MRVILRSIDTGLFYAGPGTWTAEHEEALDFCDTARALDAAVTGNLERVEVVMSFEHPKFEIPLTIVSLGT